jgi:DNA-binding CsgD family transcriptional regulator
MCNFVKVRSIFMKHSSSSRVNSFYKDWVNFSTRNFSELKEHKSNFELFNDPQFINLFKNAPSIVLVVNHAEHKYEFFSENVKQILGFEAEEFYKGNVEFGLSHIHPEHAIIFSEHLFPAMFNAIERYKDQDLKKLRLTYNFKFKRKDGVYVWLSQHMSILEIDKEKNPLLSMYFMSDINALKKDSKLDFTVSVLDEKGYYIPVQISAFPEGTPLAITTRELEILKLIGSGKSSQLIADELGISRHTVNTHRKNMLEKTGTKNTSELLNLSLVKGLI